MTCQCIIVFTVCWLTERSGPGFSSYKRSRTSLHARSKRSRSKTCFPPGVNVHSGLFVWRHSLKKRRLVVFFAMLRKSTVVVSTGFRLDLGTSPCVFRFFGADGTFTVGDADGADGTSLVGDIADFKRFLSTISRTSFFDKIPSSCILKSDAKDSSLLFFLGVPNGERTW